ncbi:uncharacterized protein LOC143920866 [Arctopsyche grandis]|uniref:uncharacterized protein LOC143920866 n=1 Tax=Arctopsyche grandis TaxID=121162 RepID=UPI00406D74DE
MSNVNGVEANFARLGIDLCGLSLDWLLDNNNTCKPLLWLQDSLSSENVLTPQLAQQYADLKEDEILTDEELNIEFEKLILDNTYNFTISDRDCNLIEEDFKLDDINRKIDLATQHIESVELCVNRGLELNSKFSKDLEHHKNIRREKLCELSEITKQCHNKTATLDEEKTHLKNLIKDETNFFISTGKDFRNQLNEEHFDEYFASCDSLTAFFHNHINNNLQKPCKTLDGSIDEDEEAYFERVDPQLIISSRNKMEIAIHNYMKAKAELSEAKETLKFHLRYDENDNSSSSMLRELNKKLRRLEFADKGSQRVIKNFVENQMANILYGDLKLKSINLEYLFKELTIVESHAKNLGICSKLLSTSLMNQEKRKDKIVAFFYSVVKSLISEVTVVQKRQMIVDKLKAIPFESYIFDKFLYVKNEIYKLFGLDENMPLQFCIENINTKFKEFDKIKDYILNGQFVGFLSEYKQNISKLVPVQQFIWDGAAGYPNICNRSLDLHLFECEQKNESDSAKIKKAMNVYKQLRENSNSDTLSSSLRC